MSNSSKLEDFTKGNIPISIIRFSIPLLFGNLLQQLYFMADSALVGKFIGKMALASVGNAAAITSLIIFFFQGITSGSGILVAHSIGEKNNQKIVKLVQASSLLIVFMGTFISLILFIFVKDILIAISIPSDILKETTNYVQIVILGSLPLLIYNMGASILQAIGDSKSPINYLAISCVINIFLDYVFLRFFHLGVESTAIATVISQIITGYLIYRKLKLRIETLDNTEKEEKSYAIDRRKIITLKDLKAQIHSIKEVVKVGLPMGIQAIVINFSHILVQNYINGIGIVAVAAWSIFSRVDTFVILPFLSVRNSIITFVGQNYGAKNRERILLGVRWGTIISLVITVAISMIIVIFSSELLNIFITEKNVVEMAESMINSMIPYYFVIAIASGFIGGISGIGNSKMSMIINVSCMCVSRMIMLPIFPNFFGYNMDTLYYIYWTSWIMTCVFSIYYYERYTKRNLNMI